jgi:hypothetical protein
MARQFVRAERSTAPVVEFRHQRDEREQQDNEGNRFPDHVLDNAFVRGSSHV